MIVIEIPQNRPNSDREVAFPNAETQKGQVPINKGIANADVTSRVASGIFLGQAIKNADGVNELGSCPAVAPVAQAASNQIVRRPHAASFQGHAPPLERELKIARLRDKIDLRRAKIWKLEEEVNDLQNELETLTTEAMNAADWEEVRASVRRISGGSQAPQTNDARRLCRVLVHTVTPKMDCIVHYDDGGNNPPGGK
jgi:hypothetical protein